MGRPSVGGTEVAVAAHAVGCEDLVLRAARCTTFRSARAALWLRGGQQYTCRNYL